MVKKTIETTCFQYHPEIAWQEFKENMNVQQTREGVYAKDSLIS